MVKDNKAIKLYSLSLNYCFNLWILMSQGPGSLDILEGHSKATMLLICNNAAQGILSSFFFKYAGDYLTTIYFVLQLIF